MYRGAWYSPWSHTVGTTEVTEQELSEIHAICLAACINCVGQLTDPFSHRLVSLSPVESLRIICSIISSSHTVLLIQKFLSN